MPHCRPKAHLLRSMASAHLDWERALGEWVDNSLDAGANSISISVSAKQVVVTDNGAGCSSLEDFAILGEHKEHKTTRLGRYGIGSKDAALWVGGERSTLSVESIHGGKLRRLQFNWREMVDADWWIPDPTVQPAAPGGRGTKLSVGPVERKIHSWPDLVEKIGFIYSPALKRGAQITMQRGSGQPQPVPRWERPPLLPGHIDTQIVVAGRKARVFCGIVEEGHPNQRGGLSYAYDYRIILPASSRGCGDYNISRICGFVDLDESWPLSKNKDGLSTRDQDELFLMVEDAIRPVLEKAEQTGIQLQSHSFELAVSNMLNAALAIGRQRDAKAKRGSGRTEGTVEPTGNGEKHRRAAVEQRGQTFPGRQNAGRCRIIHERKGERESIGRFDEPNIYLNLDHPWVEGAFRSANEIATVQLAATLIVANHCMEDPKKDRQRVMLSVAAPRTDFGKVLGELLARGITIDGKPLPLDGGRQ